MQEAYSETTPKPVLDRQPPPGPARLWENLVLRIRAGDTRAAEEFTTLYTRGARLLLKRLVSPIGLDLLVQEAMAGAVAEARRGALQTPADLVRFLRTLAARQASACTLAQAERQRVRRKAQTIEIAWSTWKPRERDMLSRFYLAGQPRESILADMHATPAEFDALRARLREAVSRSDLRKRPSSALPCPAVRTATAG